MPDQTSCLVEVTEVDHCGFIHVSKTRWSLYRSGTVVNTQRGARDNLTRNDLLRCCTTGKVW